MNEQTIILKPDLVRRLLAEQFLEYDIKAKSPILEPMRGSGFFLFPLLVEGFNVHGVDVSNHMLQAILSLALRRHFS